MKVDNLGVPRFTESDLFDIIYTGQIEKCTDVLCENSQEIEKFNQTAAHFVRDKLAVYEPLNVSQTEFDATLQAEWFMPESYQQIDVYEYLKDKCTTPLETDRTILELEEFENRDMFNVLRYMIFLVDFMREHKIVWGVGRGSSVASFVLYLIGIHRINSIQYQLDFNEFMR